MKTFLICAVRGHAREETEEIVRQLEAEGWEVHWPHRDTDQDDDCGLRICLDNLVAIQESDVVHVVWDESSTGSHFDLGMAFALRKPLILIVLPPPTDGKSFPNMMRAWARQGTKRSERHFWPDEPETTDQKTFKQYVHHDNAVWVRADLLGTHREHCLCYNCKSFLPNDQKANCRIASLLYAVCRVLGLTTPVWECPHFEDGAETTEESNEAIIP